ncbi:MAG: peptidase M14 [Ruminococcaceae bacterium]|nr:peptidase M14 [Oscillospiraceae bacterium]
MKRIIAIFLIVTLLWIPTSCIKEGPPAETAPPPPVEAPLVWSDSDAIAEQFLMQSGIVDCSKREYSYEEMVADLNELSAAYPSLLSYRAFGESVLGRELYVAVLGNPNATRQILVSAGIHGREYLTPLLAMKQIEFYLTYSQNGLYGDLGYSALFNDTCFYIVPMTNPDGIMMAQAGVTTITNITLRQELQSIYHKDFEGGYTKQTQIDEYLKIWKANANGVDLNRNFDALWDEYNGIRRKSHKNFKGTEPNSEPETQAMIALTESLPNIQAVISLHSQGEVLYWNCGQEDELAQKTLDFTQMLSAQTGYEVKTQQNNDASYTDWCALQKGLIAVTVETGTDTCPLPISQFPTIWMQNYDLLAASAAYFQAN